MRQACARACHQNTAWSQVFAVKEDDVPDPDLPDDAQMTVIPVTMIFFMVDGGDGCTQGE